MSKKPSVGRQKIKMAKIEIKNHLQVTFSKRRSGLFKKASELCTLCGVEIALIVFSPAGKVFSFGHPNVESIVDRLLTRSTSTTLNKFHLVGAHGEAIAGELNLQLRKILNELEGERKKGETLEITRKASQKRNWWESPIDQLGLHEVEQLRDAMEELKKNVTSHINKLMSDVVNQSSFLISDGDRDFDHYHSKSTQVNPSSSAPLTDDIGFCHEFF